MLPEVHDGIIGPSIIGQLKDAVMARAEPGRPYPGGANRGGWKSGVDLFSWPDAAVRALYDIIGAVLSRDGYRVGNAWAVVNRNGSYHGRHRHGVPLMGLVFVASGNPAVPTVFEIGKAEVVEIEPRPGRLVICGDLYHHVPVYVGSTPRIAIAFDARRAGA
jgi:hypothetical protein